MISILHLVDSILKCGVDISICDIIGRNAVYYILYEYGPWDMVECMLPSIEKYDLNIKKVIENVEILRKQLFFDWYQ